MPPPFLFYLGLDSEVIFYFQIKFWFKQFILILDNRDEGPRLEGEG